MNKSNLVRLVNDPIQVGMLTGREQMRRKRRMLQVQFADVMRWVPESQLEYVQDYRLSPLDMLETKKLGRPEDLRRTLTHVKLSGRLADVIYSMEATNTDFYAYQFKPVVKVLESPSNGILIADEVGLGKTIEAGLIWTELRSRFDMRRLLVLCPVVFVVVRCARAYCGHKRPLADRPRLRSRAHLETRPLPRLLGRHVFPGDVR